MRPHLGLEVDAPRRDRAAEDRPAARRHLHIDPLYLDTIRAGLHDAASQPGGTSADVFGDFPEQVYGKTGTAQHNDQADQSWYACFVPDTATTKPILVVVTVEQGGFGAAAAAPAARQILSQWFYRQARASSWPGPRRRYERRPRSRPPSSRRPSRAPRTLLRFDPLLMLARARSRGLLADHAEGRHQDHAVPGHPLFYVERQAIYAGIGVVLAIVLSRIDYSRSARVQVRLYGLLIALNIVVFGMPAVRGAAPLDPAAVLPVPVLGVRQGAADRVAGGVRRRSLAAAARTAHDGADHAAGAAAGADRDPPARPRHRPGVRGDRVHDAVLRRHLVEAARPRWSRCSCVSVALVLVGARRRSACTCSSPTRCSG